MFPCVPIYVINSCGDHGGAVVTHVPPTSEVCRSNPGHYVGQLVPAYRCSAVYSTEP